MKDRGQPLLLAVAILAGFSTPPAKGGVVEEWNAGFLKAVQADATPPGLAARNLAILHLGIEGAVESATKAGLDPAPAANAAGHLIASRLYAGHSGAFDGIFKGHAKGEGRGDDPGRAAATGRELATKILKAREVDGASLSVHYHPDAEPGQWRRTTRNRPPELPQWPRVKPFALKSADQFRPGGPPLIGSAEWRAALEEVKAWGGKASVKRTKEQALIARFWADFTYTSTPPGHWNEIAREVSLTKKLDIARSAQLFATLNTALADAGIAAFDCKYHYNLWRPSTAIGFASGGDREWEPLLPTPSHPEYVSAHSAFSAAASEVLAATFGDDTNFTARSIDVPGVLRRYRSFRKCAKEIGMSRLYGGIHYRFSNEDGLALGRSVAKWVLGRRPPIEGATSSSVSEESSLENLYLEPRQQ